MSQVSAVVILSDSYYTFSNHDFSKIIGGDEIVYVMSHGQALDPTSVRAEIDNNCAFIRVLVPGRFYENITSLTDAQVLAVFV